MYVSCRPDVLALARDPETGLFKPAHCIEVIPGSLGNVHHDFDFAHILSTKLFIDHRQVFANGVTDILDSFFFRPTLGPTAGKAGHRNAVSLFRLVQGNPLFHGHLHANSIARPEPVRLTLAFRRDRRPSADPTAAINSNGRQMKIALITLLPFILDGSLP